MAAEEGPTQGTSEAATGLSTRRALLGGLAVLVVTGLSRTIAMGASAAVLGVDLGSEDPAVRRDGLLLGIGLLAGALAGGAVLALVVRPAPVRALALERPTARSAALWIGLLLGQILFFHAVALALGRPLVEPSWAGVYRSGPAALLALGLIGVSIFEELYFRGLMQGALGATRLGVPGAIASIATVFTLAHFPEDLWRVADVLSGAVLLSLSRRYSKSILPGIVAHVVGNLQVLLILAASG